MFYQTVGESPFDFETTNQYILNVTITDDGTPNESSNVNITVNITDEVELLIPTEDVTFGRPITGELDLSNIFLVVSLKTVLSLMATYILLVLPTMLIKTFLLSLTQIMVI
ncbi:hypothetical protein P4S63_13660 [Pseudoalteromonas sp. B193]